MSDDRRFVIVGGGLAGAMAAVTLREEGFEGDVHLLCAETVLPYERPPLSKGGLVPDRSAAAEARDKARVRDADYYRDNRIAVELGVTVNELDPVGRRLRVEGGELDYDRLLIATGSQPVRLPLPGADLDGVHYLRTLPDAEGLDEALVGGARVLIVGAGWIGLEVAAAARGRGAEVVAIDPAEIPLARALGPEVGSVYADIHREHGVDLRMSTGLVSLAGPGRVESATLATGETLDVDAVVVGVGARPVTSLAEQAGLAVDDGILVDDRLGTSDDFVWAAGDCARLWSPFYGRRLRVEHWANAKNSGAAAARSMLAETPGQAQPYDRLPYFYSDQYDVGMEFSGWFDQGEYTSVVFRGDPAAKGREFLAFYVVDDGSGTAGRVVAALNVNVWDVVGDLQALIRSRASVAYARLSNPGVPLDGLVNS